MLDFGVDLEGKIAHEQQTTLLDQGHDGCGGVGCIGRKEQIHLVHVQELGVKPRREGAIALIIVGDQFNLALEQSAPGIDVFNPHANSQK